MKTLGMFCALAGFICFIVAMIGGSAIGERHYRGMMIPIGKLRLLTYIGIGLGLLGLILMNFG